MREILFRGQTRRKGQKVRVDGTPVDSNWVYGGCFPGTGDYSVIYTYDPIDKYPVYTETVGQYTGRKDKNGVMIFEGDIVRSSDPDYPESKMDCGIGQVEFYAGLWYVSGEVQNGLYDLFDICCKDLEVIGNVFDNPELLEE